MEAYDANYYYFFLMPFILGIPINNLNDNHEQDIRCQIIDKVILFVRVGLKFCYTIVI